MFKQCFNCGSNTSYSNNWYKLDGKYQCRKCYNRTHNLIQYRVTFKNKRVWLGLNPRTGVCSECGRTNCKTDIHHIQYHDYDPLRDTIELCVGCHNKTHPKSRKVTIPDV